MIKTYPKRLPSLGPSSASEEDPNASQDDFDAGETLKSVGSTLGST